jgi:hypothetical protein
VQLAGSSFQPLMMCFHVRSSCMLGLLSSDQTNHLVQIQGLVNSVLCTILPSPVFCYRSARRIGLASPRPGGILFVSLTAYFSIQSCMSRLDEYFVLFRRGCTVACTHVYSPTPTWLTAKIAT